jgi:hypothetical protein
MFGLLPAYGLFVRHAANISVRDVEFSFAQPDTRPAVVLMDVAGIAFAGVKAQRTGDAAFFVLRDVTDFTARACPTLPDTRRATAKQETLP